MLALKSKKLILSISFFGLFITGTFSQVAGDFRSIATGNFNLNTTWETYNGSAWVAAVAAPTAASGTITIQSPFTVSVSAILANSATIVINAGGTLRTLIGIAFTNNVAGIVTNNGTIINSASGATASIINNGTINNNLTVTNNGIFTNNLTFNNNAAGITTQVGAGAFTNAAAGTITNLGTITINATRTITNNGIIINSATITPTGTLTHGAGSFYRHSFSSAVAPNGTIPASTWNATSTCEILSCGNSGSAPTGLGQAFGHFIWNNTTQPIDVNFLGAMSMPTTGNFTLSSTNGFNISLVSTAAGGATSIGGNFSITNGNITIIKVNNINKTNQLSITGTYSQSGGTMTIANCTGSLAGNTANGTLTIGSTSTISGGTLNVNTSSWVGAGGNGTLSSGLITLSGTGVLNGCSSSALLSSGVAGTITATAGVTVNAGGTLNLNSSTTTGTGGLSILNSGGAFLIAGGTVNLASGAAVASTGCTGTLNVNTGGFTISSGTLNLCSSATTTGGGNGLLNVSSGNFVHSGGTVSKTGINSGTITINGSTAQTIRSGGFSVGNSITFNLSQNTAAAGATTINTGFIIASGTTFNINDNNFNTTDFTPGMAITNNGAVNVNASAELDMGTFVMSGTGSFSTNTGALLITKHATGISITGGLGCIQVTGTKTFAADGDYTYNGTTSQDTGDGLPATLNGGILTINNSTTITTGGVTLTRATTILEGVSTTGSLVLTQGRFITTLTNLITIGDDATCAASGITRFVDGPIKKIGDDVFIYPTGDLYTATGGIATVKWARIEITAPATTADEFTAEYHKLNDPCDVNQAVSNTNGAGINHVSYKEYWDLTRVAGASSPDVKLYWENGSIATSLGSGISSIAAADLHVAECIASTWTDKGAGATTGIAAGPGTIRSITATTWTTGTIMPFTFAAPNSFNPLPVELLSFDGIASDNGNQLNWSTATETNNDYFDLERSSTGIDFVSIVKINGSNNSTSIKNYEYLDTKPISGLNYYRLKQVDFDGNYSYSNIISIENNFSQTASLQLFPNPCQDLITIVSTEEYTSLIIYNILGAIVYSSNSNQGLIQFHPLSDGIYVVKATTLSGKEISSRFIKN